MTGLLPEFVPPVEHEQTRFRAGDRRSVSNPTAAQLDDQLSPDSVVWPHVEESSEKTLQ